MNNNENNSVTKYLCRPVSSGPLPGHRRSVGAALQAPGAHAARGRATHWAERGQNGAQTPGMRKKRAGEHVSPRLKNNSWTTLGALRPPTLSIPDSAENLSFVSRGKVFSGHCFQHAHVFDRSGLRSMLDPVELAHGPTLPQHDLILTYYVRSDPISKLGHSLQHVL